MVNVEPVHGYVIYNVPGPAGTSFFPNKPSEFVGGPLLRSAPERDRRKTQLVPDDEGERPRNTADCDAGKKPIRGIREKDDEECSDRSEHDNGHHGEPRVL